MVIFPCYKYLKCPEFHLGRETTQKNPGQLLTIDNGLPYHNQKGLNAYKDEKESSRKDSKSFNNKSNDEKVDYQNAAYLKDRGIYPISFLFVENAGKKHFISINFNHLNYIVFSKSLYLNIYSQFFCRKRGL